MDELWNQFTKWLEANYAEELKELNPPASDKEIAELEKLIESKLPQDFIDLLKVHNGQKSYTGGLFDGSEFLSTQRIADEWNIWKQLLDSGEFDGSTSEPEEGIKDDWWNSKWIPFTYDGAGNHLCIDLDPDVKGNVGQIITMWHDDLPRELEAVGFKVWFESYVSGVIAGDYVCVEEYDGIVKKEDI